MEPGGERADGGDESVAVNGNGADVKVSDDDKKLLRHVAGGAIVGGTVGTAVGAVGGELLGHAVGLAVGGPGCASLGGWVGRIAGVFGGSYGMARAGAWIGRHLNHGRV